MWASIGWGAFAASALILGALLGLARSWPPRLVGLVLAFGAGALIAAVSFELALEGTRRGGAAATALGLGAGALAYVGLDQVIARRRGRKVARPARRGGSAEAGLGAALVLGAVLDGIPEQLVLGTGIATEPGVNAALLLAIFVSNLPEAMGSATDLSASGHSSAAVIRLWAGVAVICVGANVAGYALADVATGGWSGVVYGFAAGALLVMLIDSMIPAAARRAGSPAGLATVVGFATAFGLSLASM